MSWTANPTRTPELARIINEHFIAVKVDRDERPDVDARYQAAVSAISGQGGWPLTAFLTPDGRPYFGGTYFPRDDRYGRPGFGRVLRPWPRCGETAATKRSNPPPASWPPLSTTKAFSGRERRTCLWPSSTRSPAPPLRNSTRATAASARSPNFPIPRRSIFFSQLAVNRGNAAGPRSLHRHARKDGARRRLRPARRRLPSLQVDERWVVPHFEKMLYDNTELLRNYRARLPELRPRRLSARPPREIVAWLDAVMTDRERGGFYASQDADINLDDDGDYFTWTLDEARAVLDPKSLPSPQLY